MPGNGVSWPVARTGMRNDDADLQRTLAMGGGFKMHKTARQKLTRQGLAELSTDRTRDLADVGAPGEAVVVSHEVVVGRPSSGANAGWRSERPSTGTRAELAQFQDVPRPSTSGRPAQTKFFGAERHRPKTSSSSKRL